MDNKAFHLLQSIKAAPFRVAEVRLREALEAEYARGREDGLAEGAMAARELEA